MANPDLAVGALAKPEPYRRVKARKRRQFAKARKSCRAARYLRDGGCCVRCGKPLKLNPSEARHEFEIAHIHEMKPRSLGGDPLDANGQKTLCFSCHEQEHGRHIA